MYVKNNPVKKPIKSSLEEIVFCYSSQFDQKSLFRFIFSSTIRYYKKVIMLDFNRSFDDFNVIVYLLFIFLFTQLYETRRPF